MFFLFFVLRKKGKVTCSSCQSKERKSEEENEAVEENLRISEQVRRTSDGCWQVLAISIPSTTAVNTRRLQLDDNPPHYDMRIFDVQISCNHYIR